MNSKTRNAFGPAIPEKNPVDEVLVHGQLDGTGVTASKPRFFQGRRLGAMQIGMAVVLSGLVAAAIDETGGDSVSFSVSAPGGLADGIVHRVDGDFVQIRTLDGDMQFANTTVGADYVVGTDGRPAKAGDPNYPVAVASPVVIGVGWVNGRIMLGLAGRHGAAAASVANHYLGDSDAIADAVATRVQQGGVNVDLKFDPRLLRVGDEIEFKAIAAIGAGSLNPRLQIKIGTAVLLTFMGPAPNALGDEFVAEGRIIVRETGSTGKVITTGICYTAANGLLPASGYNVAPLAIDLSVPLITIDTFGYFSGSGANSLILRDSSLRLRA